MGDRANAVIKDGAKHVYLYTHWCGHELPQIVKSALDRKQRWNDPQYLARIVFCEMLKHDGGDPLGNETGFGISQEIGDNSYPLIVLDTHREVVRFCKEGDLEHGPEQPFDSFDGKYPEE